VGTGWIRLAGSYFLISLSDGAAISILLRMSGDLHPEISDDQDYSCSFPHIMPEMADYPGKHWLTFSSRDYVNMG